MRLSRRLGAEALGTAFLLAVVVGSGIKGERLAAGNAGIRPSDVGGFVAVEIIAALAATFLARWFYQTPKGSDPR